MERGRSRNGIYLLPLGLVLLGLATLGTLVGPASPAGPRLTLERLYSLPRLIGTAPRGVAWSRDSRRLAFLWNDEGTNFYDVWTAAVEDLRTVRVTRMPRLEPSAGDDPDAKEKSLQAELDAGVSAVSWYPDGGWLLFVFRGDLYAVEPGGLPRRLTETPGAESQAQFSADGRQLAYLLEGDIWVMPVAGGAPRQLTRLAIPSVSIDSYRWSPDGKALAFIERDRRRVPVREIPDYLLPETASRSIHRPLPGEESKSRRLGVVELETGAVHWMDLGGTPLDPIFTYRWSPAGSALLVDQSDLYVKDRRLLTVDPSTGAARELYREVDPENVTAYWSAAWAPDGNGVYFVSDRDEDYHLYFLAGPGASPRRITRGEGAVAEFEVFEDAIFFVGNQGRPEERQIFRVGPGGGDPVRVSHRAGTHAPLYSPDARYAAVHFSSDDTPPDLFLTRLDSAGSPEGERRVTSSPLPEFYNYTWARPRYVTFQNHLDGLTLSGRLTLPPDLDRTRKYPAILGSVYSNTVRNQWGGRTAHPTWGLDQYLAQEGYVLLNVDIRGSWGRGRALRRAIRLDYGGMDVEDLYSGVLYLKSLGFVDMDRIGIWGSSYGGLLTCMSLFKKPGVYKAGVAGAPATNVFHATTGEMRVMMRPQDQPKEYDRASAFTYAAGLRGHLMIIHGMRDDIVFFKDSVVLVERLMRLGKDVDFVVLPNSPHGWDTEGGYQTLFAFRKLIGHFERYLGKGPS